MHLAVDCTSIHVDVFFMHSKVMYVFEMYYKIQVSHAKLLGTAGSVNRLDLHRHSSASCRLVQIIMKRLIISTQQGAMTTLYCCMAHGVKGLTYYHNCLGVVPSSEVSYDTEKAAAMWELSSKLTADFQS